MDCDLGNIRVHYITYGEGKPIVLIHGYWIDHRQMIGCMEPILRNQEGWQRIYVDLPGMGKTPAAEWIKNSDHMLDVVCDFIDKVIPDKRFILAGYSYGGYLARGVISRKPDLVDGLLLFCPVIYDRSERDLPPKNILVREPELLGKLTQEEKEDLDNWVAIQSQQILERTRDEIGVGFELADVPFLSQLQEIGYKFSFDVDAKIGTFEKPVLILTGRQDWVTGYRDVWNIIERYPRATYSVLDRAGHNLPIAQEQLFNSLVIEWLDRVKEALDQDHLPERII